jgi:hypothetical protein
MSYELIDAVAEENARQAAAARGWDWRPDLIEGAPDADGPPDRELFESYAINLGAPPEWAAAEYDRQAAAGGAGGMVTDPVDLARRIEDMRRARTGAAPPAAPPPAAVTPDLPVTRGGAWADPLRDPDG